MAWQRIGFVILAGALTAAAALPARAGDCCAPACDTCTSYRTECRQENYTAYRTECVAETRTRTCTTYKHVPECHTETCSYCVSVPTVECRTVMEKHVKCVPVTCYKHKCVDRGHWECKEVECKPGLCERIKHMCKRHDCCECQECCAPRTKTVRVWVSCKVWEEIPVTHMKRVVECCPVTRQVTVCKKEMRQKEVQVTCWKCVPEQHTECYKVMVPHQVAYQACRTVSVRVPCTVEKASPCCGQSACETTCCCGHAHRCASRFGGLHLRHKDCCD